MFIFIVATLPESTPLLSYYEMQETVLKEDLQSVKVILTLKTNYIVLEQNLIFF